MNEAKEKPTLKENFKQNSTKKTAITTQIYENPAHGMMRKWAAISFDNIILNAESEPRNSVRA